MDAGEQCDDGNGIDADSCRNDCSIPRCGDRIVDAAQGETCDPPGSAAGANGATCRAECTVCGDGHVDAAEECDDGNAVAGDGCENDCTATPGAPICRSAGFWATHSGTEKPRSVNITEAVIDCADGHCATHSASDFLTICGERIGSPDLHPADGTTDVNDAASSTEALCVRVKGGQVLQLARQLTAAALNCLISGGGAGCARTPIFAATFADCNARCAGGQATRDEMTACIAALDCLNNGGTFLDGLCAPRDPNSCASRPLVNEDLGLAFDPPGPAGSPDACNAANESRCTIVGGEDCSTDTLP